MRRDVYVWLTLGLFTSFVGLRLVHAEPASVRPLPLEQVELNPASTLGMRVESARTTTLPHMMEHMEKRGFFANFVKAGGGHDSRYHPSVRGDAYAHCAVEGLGHTLRSHDDPTLRAQGLRSFNQLKQGQEQDGYIYTAQTLGKTKYERWLNELGALTNHDSHELYNHGHFIETSIAIALGLGRAELAAPAHRAALLIAHTWGPDRLDIPPGHPGIELALLRLHEVTGEKIHLDTARFLMECRGTGKHACARHRTQDYYVNHLPVTRQREPTGHAVRATYLYNGMSEYARLSGNAAYATASQALWAHMVSRKIYLTGGIGSVRKTEGFGPDYDLPLDSYAETCASISVARWARSLFRLSPDSAYIDVMERVIYNAIPAGVSLDGQRFFYSNPMEVSHPGKSRQPWHHTPCCLGNLVRFMPQLPEYLYAQTDEDLYVNLYAPSHARFKMDRQTVRFRVMTDYPWDGRIELEFAMAEPQAFTLRFRVPGWATGTPIPGNLYRDTDAPREPATCEINGNAVTPAIEKGYFVIRRTWSTGDRVVVNLPMPVRIVKAHENVKSVRGRIAFERGPLVYCAESADNAWDFIKARLSRNVEPSLIRRQGIVLLEVPAGSQTLRLIPYALWDNRGVGAMRLWFPLK